MNALFRIVLLVACLLCLAPRGDAQVTAGHSRHGTAFDSGLRQKPWKMEGIGKSHFPITTKNPEVQVWFDQGNTLLHSFWYEEAERSFRWCLKLDPECAMAYWGLARATEGDRSLAFLKEAVRRKDGVTLRERMYIEASEAATAKDVKDADKVLATHLQRIAVQFPDDIEAKALYALTLNGAANALGVEAVTREILAVDPVHPGAHHYRIHNWDYVSPELALLSCQQYGAIAPGIGHAAHMPGHVYSKVGMWHEAARSMDSATRVELRYMNQRLALPFETWNYAHNRNYLCYIQEQLGREKEALRGARDLIAAPRDPDRNQDEGFEAAGQGVTALVRGLIKFERWDEILRPGAIPWRSGPMDENLRAFAETLAQTGRKNLVAAKDRLASLKELVRRDAGKTKSDNPFGNLLASVAEGQLRASEGDILEATRLLTHAAFLEQQLRDARNFSNDPPMTPWPVVRLLGDAYLQKREYRLALLAYERALQIERNDAFSLSGLAQAHVGLGEREKAQAYYGRLLAVWSGADPGLRWRKEADALGLEAKPLAVTPAPEREYRPEELAAFGPGNWEPFAAPKLDVRDTEGKPVTLERYRGKNVILVFYLGDECVHCVEQLAAINARAAEWKKENTVVLAVSSATPQKNKESLKLGTLSLSLLSDTNHANARRFASYDDFEEMELHSTILIDTAGRVRWKRTGGDPFMNVDFLAGTIKRMNQTAAPLARSETASHSAFPSAQ